MEDEIDVRNEKEAGQRSFMLLGLAILCFATAFWMAIISADPINQAIDNAYFRFLPAGFLGVILLFIGRWINWEALGGSFIGPMFEIAEIMT